MWVACATLMAQVILAAARFADPQLPCLQPALSPNVIVVQPGANVFLPCLEKDSENTTTVHWTFEGQNLSSHPSRNVVPESNLSLPSVYYNSSGHYSCHTGGRVIRSHRLVVEEPPETPDFICHQRSLAKYILCEWKASRPMSLRTKARLWVRKGFIGENYTEEQCRYYTKSRKFSCRLSTMNNEDDIFLAVFACVVNLAGAVSKQKFLRTDALLKPDPPADVVVNAVENAPCKLHVTWRNPYSWGSTFYRLQFQLRYRAENSEAYSEVHLQHGITSCTISDALKSLRHYVQVRGREEFDHGSWSEWSRETTGLPWTEHNDPESDTTTDIAKFPFDDYFVSTSRPRTPEFPGKMDKPAVAVVVPLHSFLLMALSVTVALVLAVGILFRYRKKLGLLHSGEGKPSSVPSYSLAPLGPELPLSASPLLSPPASPFSESSADSPSILDQNSPYDVSNADYFLLPK